MALRAGPSQGRCQQAETHSTSQPVSLLLLFGWCFSAVISPPASLFSHTPLSHLKNLNNNNKTTKNQPTNKRKTTTTKAAFVAHLFEFAKNVKHSLFLISDKFKDQRQRKSRHRHTRQKESAGLGLGFFFFLLLSPSKAEDPAGPVWIFIKKKPKIINFFVFVLFAGASPAGTPGCLADQTCSCSWVLGCWQGSADSPKPAGATSCLPSHLAWVLGRVHLKLLPMSLFRALLKHRAPLRGR